MVPPIINNGMAAWPVLSATAGLHDRDSQAHACMWAGLGPQERSDIGTCGRHQDILSKGSVECESSVLLPAMRPNARLARRRVRRRRLQIRFQLLWATHSAVVVEVKSCGRSSMETGRCGVRAGSQLLQAALDCFRAPLFQDRHCIRPRLPQAKNAPREAGASRDACFALDGTRNGIQPVAGARGRRYDANVVKETPLLGACARGAATRASCWPATNNAGARESPCSMPSASAISNSANVDFHLHAACKAFHANIRRLCDKSVLFQHHLLCFDAVVTPAACYAAAHRKILRDDLHKFDVIFHRLLGSAVSPPGDVDWTRPWHEILHVWNRTVREQSAFCTIDTWATRCLKEGTLETDSWVLRALHWTPNVASRRRRRPPSTWQIEIERFNRWQGLGDACGCLRRFFNAALNGT